MSAAGAPPAPPPPPPPPVEPESEGIVTWTVAPSGFTSVVWIVMPSVESTKVEFWVSAASANVEVSGVVSISWVWIGDPSPGVCTSRICTPPIAGELEA